MTMDISFLGNDPRTQNIHPLKLKLLTELANNSKGHSIEELLPQIMMINKELDKRNLRFSNEETNLLLDLIESNLSDSEISRFRILRELIKNA